MDSFASDAIELTDTLAHVAVASASESHKAFDFLANELARIVGFTGCSLLLADDSHRAIRVIGTTSRDTSLPRREWILPYQDLGLLRSDGISHENIDTLCNGGKFSTFFVESNCKNDIMSFAAPIISNASGERKLIGFVRFRGHKRLIGRADHYSAIDSQRILRIARLIAPLFVLAQSRIQRDNLLMSVRHEFNTPATMIRNAIDIQTTSAKQSLAQSLRGTMNHLHLIMKGAAVTKSQLSHSISLIQSNMTTLHEWTEDIKQIAANAELLLLVGSMLEVFTDKPLDPVIRKHILYHDAVNSCVQSIRPLAKRDGIVDVAIIGDLTSLPPVHIDVRMCMLCLYNLLKNAIKYSDKQSSIRVHLHTGTTVSDLKYVFIDVINDGIGVDVGAEEKIFEPYYRTDAAMGKWVSGVGIGLTVARQLARLMDGDVVLVQSSAPTIFRMKVLAVTAERIHHVD